MYIAPPSHSLFQTTNPITLLVVCAATSFLNQNSDVFLGYVGWAAGAFGTDYDFALTPNKQADQPLLTKCIAARLGKGKVRRGIEKIDREVFEM